MRERASVGARRDRITIDLRGLGVRLQARAASRRMTAAVWVRSAIVAILGDEGGDTLTAVATPAGGRVVKVTVRLRAAHAVQLAALARAADVSQGTYVSSFIDGSPLAPNHADAIAALARSVNQLAALSGDLNALMRLLRRGESAPAVALYRSRVVSLEDDVRRHLSLASRVVAELRPGRQARDRDALRRDRG